MDTILKLARYICLILLVAWPISGFAQTTPEVDNPALRQAALDWLDGDDPLAATRAIGDIAATGNVAAQMLANDIYRRFLPLDFPQMSRADRRALFAPAETSRRGFSNPFAVNIIDSASGQARQVMSRAKTPAEWIAGAEVLVAAGQIDRLLWFMSGLGNYPDLNIEAYKFMTDYINPADAAESDVWLFRGLSQAQLGFFDATDPTTAAENRARWNEPPWSSEQDADFASALTQGRFSAIRALGFLIIFDPDLPERVGASAELFRLAQILRSTGVFGDDNIEPATAGELQALGDVVITDATRSAYLRPLVSACAAACPDDMSTCVGAGALSDVHAIQLPLFQESLISGDEFYGSDRATRELMLLLGWSLGDVRTKDRFSSLPGCLTTAAARAAALATPDGD